MTKASLNSTNSTRRLTRFTRTSQLTRKLNLPEFLERIFNNDTEIKNRIENKTFLGFKWNKNFKDLLVHRKRNNTFYKSKPGSLLRQELRYFS